MILSIQSFQSLLLVFFLTLASGNLYANGVLNNLSVSPSVPKSSFVLSQEEKAWIASHPEIKVAIHHGWAPIEFISEGGEFRGISANYLNRLEKILRLKFVKIDLTEAPSIEHADMLSAVPSVGMLKNSRFIPLNKPYLTIPMVIFTRADNDDVHGLSDLIHKKIAVFKTGAITQTLSQQHPEINLYKVDIAEEALSALVSKKVDAYVGNKVVISYAAYSAGLKAVKIAGETPYSATLTMAVRDDWPLLTSILQKGLAQISAEERDSILDNWSESHAQLANKWLIFAIGAFLVSIIAALGFRGWKLNAESTRRNKVSQDLIWQQANFDSLTQLPNRQMFHDRLAQEIKQSDRAGLPMAILFLDLDHFKQVNDSFGHVMGDMLLIEASKRLSQCVRSADTVARLGGDEFTIILSALHDVSSIERVTQDILQKMAEPFKLNHEMAYISTSIGITLYPEDATDIETLLKNADQAMYAAKSLGRNCFHYFTSSMQEASDTRMHIANDLRVAVSENQFHLLYQPIIELSSGSIHKAEALIRWQHPQNGLVNPIQFITIAEDTGLIVPIGDWVFYEAVAQVAKWQQLIHPNFQISINSSPVQFKNEANFQTWIAYIQKHQLAEQSLVIEITEGILLEAKSTVKHQLSEFRKVGIKIAIDDFGTGYSSLAYLKKFDVDYVKIDRAFILNLKADTDEMVLCQAIIVMAQTLGLKVIAEGVETAEQEKLLMQAGCDYAQGYLYAKPLSSADFELYINKRLTDG